MGEITSIGCRGGRAATCHNSLLGIRPIRPSEDHQLLFAGTIEAIDRPLLYCRLGPILAISFRTATWNRLKIIHWRSFISALVYSRGRQSSRTGRKPAMSWKTPKIVEVPVGMEINMYACAARK
jgi:coenzyme PQQ precursor peptide PqqA